jgi:hypothetical protein
MRVLPSNHIFNLAKIRSVLKRSKADKLPCVAYGTGNLSRKIGRGYFFYDYDTQSEEEVQRFRKYVQHTLYVAYVLFRTKHGVMVMSTLTFNFEQLRKYYDQFQAEFSSDYLWDIPLFLRLSEKWDWRTGTVVSAMPQIIDNPKKIDIYRLNREDMYPKKWYRTSD